MVAIDEADRGALRFIRVDEASKEQPNLKVYPFTHVWRVCELISSQCNHTIPSRKASRHKLDSFHQLLLGSNYSFGSFINSSWTGIRLFLMR